MRRFVVLLAACAASVAAAAADPLKSPACDGALANLRTARAHADVPAARLEVLRAIAARTCLGGTGEATRPSPMAQAPIGVPLPAITTPAPAVPAPALPPLAVDRPPVLTNCDKGGCWDSNGTRLNRSGPLLIGPGGVCTTAGPVVRCP